MKPVLLALVIYLGPAFAAAAQDEPNAQPETDNPFFASAIPEDFPARFSCHQTGREILLLDEVRSFAPKLIDGVMTFSLITRDGVNHLLYLGSDTTCGLSVAPPSQ